MSQLETNKSIVRRFFEEVFNQHDSKPIDEIIAPDYRDYGSTPPLEGPEGAKSNFESLFSGVDEVKFELEDLIAEGDRVAARWTGEMRHQAEFFGFKATGKKVRFSGITMYKLRDNQILEARPAQDIFGLLNQLGSE